MPPIKYDPNSVEEIQVPLPCAPLTTLSNSVVLQRPLTRRGIGPGLILFLPTSTQYTTRRGLKVLDPEPIQKWAEEGFATVGITSKATPDIIRDVKCGIEALALLDEVAIKDKIGLIVYNPDVLPALVPAVQGNPRVVCMISYVNFSNDLLSMPILIHLPNNNEDPLGATKVYKYPTTSSFFILPTSYNYDSGSAALAHSRTLVFLREHIGGPLFDLEAIWEEHTYFEFEVRSVAKTMGTMVAEPYVNHIPTMTGGVGRENLTTFYRDHFIFSNPPDARLQVISRTVGPDRVIDEFIYHITHDRTVDWLLPGVPPTGQKLSIPMMAVVNIRGDRLYNEHIWWDQGTTLRQVGILPEHVPYPAESMNTTLRLPIAGKECANMLNNESSEESNVMFGDDWGVSSLL
ncbi:hypothetical protein BDQ17DRAFT_1349009 [Cyathus striatus]|nr:hypothetical protein BDQ17DRAFT_1349009 [Cyathus striatus]